MKHDLAAQLAGYAALVRRYSGALDLMSPRAIENFEDKVAESLVYADLIEPHLSPAERLLDLGSGVGLPGIPLALRFPDAPLILVERRRKRARFLELVVAHLQLANVRVMATDARALSPDDVGRVAWVTAQAVGSFPLLYTTTAHLHGAAVTLVARRGDDDAALHAELAAVSGLAKRPLTLLSAPLPAHGRVIGLRFEAPPSALPSPAAG
ncbi:16S rRNA (guanine(527)-N(7))-methyltransferase RsmG [Truepera radiovictrix]|uniref:16S rRNA (guanine(527)-N(7))-methyltransferase RsmG n=1 Tax=Truepera radiovictrix TaxID=332249 RepID=UPI0002D365BE|nr:RsmG family class I SAM-dependent methyltransferase [Truepera radiovictrix]WMT58287.1 class I SAM-dependent methyltransferase [Truepera radiovictrix]